MNIYFTKDCWKVLLELVRHCDNLEGDEFHYQDCLPLSILQCLSILTSFPGAETEGISSLSTTTSKTSEAS
jgi:hypothetical protein